MRYEGKVYRPWIEADSELIQVTIGCSNNNCTFCTMFDDKKFRTRPIDEVYKDIEELRATRAKVESIFLIDGNVMVLATKYLLKVIGKIKELFPEIKNIAMYSELNDLKRKSVEELISLKQAGLDKVYSGLESGDEIVLQKIQKGMSVDDAIEGMKKAKDAGIEVLLSFIFGLGGKDRSKEHIEETTRLLNIMQPQEIAPMALAVQPNSQLADEIKSEKFIQATATQVYEEEKYLLENLEDFETYYWGDHGNNIAPQKGHLPLLRKHFLENLNEAFYKSKYIKKDEPLHTFSW